MTDDTQTPETMEGMRWWAWCGTCSEWEQISEGMPAINFKKRGWRRSEKYGWQCPRCAKAAEVKTK